jgi:hypothetical protein
MEEHVEAGLARILPDDVCGCQVEESGAKFGANCVHLNSFLIESIMSQKIKLDNEYDFHRPDFANVFFKTNKSRAKVL